MKRKAFTGFFLCVALLFLSTYAFAAPVPDTGQTTCYDNDGNVITCPKPGQPFYGQDASYSINPMFYTKLDGGGKSLPDSAESWVMVRDNVTGLIWEMKTNKDGVKNYNDPHDADNTYTWYDSNPATNGGNAGTPGNGTDTKAFIKALNDAHFGGYSDWRMPTLKELASIVYYGNSNQDPDIRIDTGYFPNTQTDIYWSSTTCANNTSGAWGLPFFDSPDCSFDKPSSLPVRAVRDGLSGVSGNYMDNGDGTVTDISTGLMWQQNGSSKNTWEQALAYCEGLNLGGYTDWRLPTIKELRSLVDYSRSSPAINTAYFPDTSAWYWSSTYSHNVRSVNFDSKSYDFNIRAVRGGQSPDQLLIFVSPASQNVTKDAGSTIFSVSNIGTGIMPWTAAVTSGGSWLSIISGSSGTNGGTITCSFTENTSTSSRIATIRVTAIGATDSPVDLTVTQVLTSFHAVAAPVPDTGQTKCYNATGEIPCPSPGQPFYGQDANYSINPMSFTKLDGNGNALSNSAESWVMVRDNVTGLIWEMKTNADGVKNYNDPHDADNTYTWYDSNPATNGGNAGTPGNGTDTEDFIKALNNAHYGGYSDWRLPTVKELDYLSNYNYNSYTLSNSAFGNNFFKKNYGSWSSTTVAQYPRCAWLPGGGWWEKSANICCAMAVRGRQPESTASAHYTDNGDGTVTDTSTGLTWQQTGPSDNMIWEEALAYCEGLTLGGYTDWRLPSIKELQSLLDYSRYYMAINTTYFPDTQHKWYLSSTTNYYGIPYAWLVDFTDGEYGHDYSSGPATFVRAVRGRGCTATIDRNLLLHIPYLSYVNPKSGTLSLWADLVYTFNPMYPTLIPFKLTNYGTINNPSFSCAASTISGDLKIHIFDVLLPDGVTHLWLDLVYSPVLSTDGKSYLVVTNYGAVSN